ncbi:MAG: hypothetical protein QM808_04025 [Steroidobacteraceae bacterium]
MTNRATPTSIRLQAGKVFLFTAALGLWFAVWAAQPTAPSSLNRDAQRLADCMKKLDAICVISLSAIKEYEAINHEIGYFPRAQSLYFENLKKADWRYTRFDFSAPTEVIVDGKY